jgi:histidinol-phosphate aminotransferase
MRPSFTRLIDSLPATVPFVGPETLERRRGRPFQARVGANESAFGLSPKAQAALTAEIGRASWYCDPEHFELRGKLADSLGVTPANLVIGEGIDGLLGVIVRSFLEPGQTVATSLGAYPTFNYHVQGYGGRLEFAPYTADCRNDIDGLLAAAERANAKLLYLANPDNPTGTFLGRTEIARLLEALPADCLLVLDEAYVEFAPAGDRPPVDIADPRVIRLRTFSKAHGMAGLRIGYAVAHAEIIAAFDKVRLHFGVGRLSQVAAAASLEDPAFIAAVVDQVAEGRRDYEALAAELRLPCIPSLTNFVAFDLTTPERSQRMVALLEERGVFVRRPGVAPLGRFVRISVGTPAERACVATALRDALATLDAAAGY